MSSHSRSQLSQWMCFQLSIRMRVPMPANIQKKIDFDKNIGAKKDKIDATPSFFVNGKAVDVQNAEDVKGEIEKRLNEELKNAGMEIGPKTTEDKTE